MTASKILFYFCISFVAGIAIESFIKIPQMVVWGIFVLGILMVMISLFLWYDTKSAVAGFVSYAGVAGFCVLVVVLGIMRFQISEFTVAGDKLRQLNDVSDQPSLEASARQGNITLNGYIADQPDIRGVMQKLKVNVGGSLVLVTVRSAVAYHYLDTVTITGKLKTPAVFDDFNYKNYLMKDKIYSVMDYPNMELIPAPHRYTIFTYAYEKILFIKSTLMAGVDTAFSSPRSDIIKGVVFGQDKNLTPELKDKFNVTGLSHITAVSGSNIVILINTLMAFLLLLGFWRGRAFYVAVALIWFYIVMIGLPISGVRAAIMGCVALLAQKLGRQNTGSRILTFTAAAMLLQNSMLLVYDISFQLSFLASLGIIHIKPLLDYYFAFISRPAFKGFFDILSVTFAAQIITLPIIVYNFGRISLVAPLTNLLVLPFIPWLTILGFLVSVAGSFSVTLSLFVALPCFVLMEYLLKVLDMFSGPWAVVIIQNVSWVWPILYYIILVALIRFLQKRQEPEFFG